MRLEQVTVQGFMTAFAGKRVTLPLRDLPDGLIAIVGDNGAGKTTLLEAGPACLYREPMGRKFTLESYAMDRDSFLEAEWSIGSDVYIARVNIDGIKGGSTAAIRRQSDLTPLNDGKVSTYDPVIARLFDPLHVFKATAFATQNKRGSFIRGGKGDRRDIINSALTLDRWVAMADTAKKAAAETEKVRVTLKAEITALELATHPREVGGLELQLTALKDAAAAATTRRQEIEHEITVVEQRLALLGDQVAAHAAATQRVTHAAEVLASRTRDLQQHDDADRRAGEAETRDQQQLSVDHDRKSKAIAARRSAAATNDAAELQAIANDLAEKLKDIESRLKGNAEIQAMKADIEAAVATIAEVTPQLQTLRAEANRQAEIERALGDELRTAEAAISAFTKPQSDLDRAKIDSALLEHVPCGGRGEFAGCQLLTNAKAAEARIAELEAKVAGFTEAVTTRDRVAVDKAANYTAWTTTKANITGLEARLTAAEPKAKYSDKLAVSEQRVKDLAAMRVQDQAEYDRRVADARQRHAAAGQQLESEQTTLDLDLDHAITALQNRIDARLVAARDARALLVAAVDDATLEHEAAVSSLAQLAEGNTEATQLQAYLATQRGHRDSATTAIATAEADAAAVGKRLADLEAKALRLTFLQARLKRLDTELLEWQQLQKALDRDGLPALETDQMGPEISETTNLILQDCMESRFSVELVTQVAKADGKGMKDDITLLVTDNTTGDVRDISDLSGGEEVIVAEAFMNALAIAVNVRSQTPTQTLFRDEADGGLSVANRQRYMRMLRKVREISGAKQIVFISQDPEAQALADAQVHVADGAVSVVLPPFSQTELAA